MASRAPCRRACSATSVTVSTCTTRPTAPSSAAWTRRWQRTATTALPDARVDPTATSAKCLATRAQSATPAKPSEGGVVGVELFKTVDLPRFISSSAQKRCNGLCVCCSGIKATRFSAVVWFDNTGLSEENVSATVVFCKQTFVACHFLLRSNSCVSPLFPVSTKDVFSRIIIHCSMVQSSGVFRGL